MKVSTVGFTKKSAQRFFKLLRESGTARIVDVRLHASSQLAGFAKKGDLAWLARELCGVEYVHEPCLAHTKEILTDYRNRKISWEEYEVRFNNLMQSRRI